MNQPINPQLMQPAFPVQPQSFQQLADDGDEINPLELLDVVIDSKWLILFTAIIITALGVAYAFISIPVYDSNILIQVEESKGSGASSLLGDTANLFEIRSPASAEMEILRSRLVVGQAVQNLQLDLRITPKYLPLVGRWLARNASGPSTPGFLGMPGYVTGTESLRLGTFDVPTAFEGKPFKIEATNEGYTLSINGGEVLGKGVVGKTLDFTVSGQKGALVVLSLVGKPGAEFQVLRASRLRETESLQGALTITEQGRQSGVIRASLQGSDPARIARTLNEIGSLYVRQNIDRKAAEAEKSLGFLGTFLPQVKSQMEESENRFNKFRSASGTFDLGNEAKVVLDQSVVLQTRLLELQQKRQELSARFTPDHPSVQTVNQQIASLNADIAALNTKSKSFPSTEQDLLSITRDVKVNNELYVNLLNSYQQLRLVKEGKVGNVRVVDVAATPESPIKPNKSLIFSVTLILGLFTGIVLAFIRNGLRPGIKNPSDIEQHVGLSVFATVPHSEAQVVQAKAVKSKAKGVHVLATASPQDPAIESLRSLRTALQFAMLDAPNNMVLITGPTPGIGKSFTSVNFAAVLGAAEKRVLLVDADLRKGHLSQYFGMPRGKGFSELISGTANLGDVLHRQVAPNVDFLSTGAFPPNPAELLMTQQTRSLLTAMAGEYDIVVIDTAPVLAASDTSILASQVGAVFMVARAEVTSLAELQEAAKRLAQTGVQTRGVIFNDLDVTKSRYGYGVGYKYGRYRYTNYQY